MPWDKDSLPVKHSSSSSKGSSATFLQRNVMGKGSEVTLHGPCPALQLDNFCHKVNNNAHRRNFC